MSSPTILPGSSSGNLQPGESTILRRNGIAEKTSVFIYTSDPGFPFIPLYTPYPNQSTGGFVCDSCKVESMSGGFYRVTVVWVSLFAGPTQYTTYESKNIQVPIDQSPDFLNIAGTPSSPNNSAIFDANGIFVGFGPGSDYQGVVSCFVIQSLLIIRGSGTAVPPLRSDIFCESFTATLRGAVWEYEQTYNLSITLQGIVAGSVDSP